MFDERGVSVTDELEAPEPSMEMVVVWPIRIQREQLMDRRRVYIGAVAFGFALLICLGQSLINQQYAADYSAAKAAMNIVSGALGYVLIQIIYLLIATRKTCCRRRANVSPVAQIEEVHTVQETLFDETQATPTGLEDGPPTGLETSSQVSLHSSSGSVRSSQLPTGTVIHIRPAPGTDQFSEEELIATTPVAETSSSAEAKIKAVVGGTVNISTSPSGKNIVNQNATAVPDVLEPPMYFNY